MLELLRLQETLGCDIVTDGELRRDNFYSFVAEKLAGVRLMTLAEMLDVVEDKAGFEQLLQTLDVPAYSISSPICTGAVERREPLAVDDLRFLRRHTDRPIKVTLPGPYLLTRAMFVPELTRAYYPTKEALAEDVVALLRAELEELAAAGADFVQFDEPVLTEVAFAPGRTRTFMCAALAARRDPAEELEFAVSLINRVVAGVDGVRLGAARLPRQLEPRRDDAADAAATSRWPPYLDRLRVSSSCWNTPPIAPATLMRVRRQGAGPGRRQPSHRRGRIGRRRFARPSRTRSSSTRRTRVPESRLRVRHVLEPPDEFLEIASAKVAAMAAAARDLRGDTRK